jgi:DNA-binding transcriptional regulator YdaS (Cro superfamily)
MNLFEYVDQFPKHMRPNIKRALAEALGVSVSMIDSVRWGRRNFHPRHARALEKFTRGQISRVDQFPDIFKK